MRLRCQFECPASNTSHFNPLIALFVLFILTIFVIAPYTKKDDFTRTVFTILNGVITGVSLGLVVGIRLDPNFESITPEKMEVYHALTASGIMGFGFSAYYAVMTYARNLCYPEKPSKVHPKSRRSVAHR